MKQKRCFGFTMAEVIAVLAILSILAAAGMAPLLSFVEQGRQANRMNMARTLFLAAQNQLAELRSTGELGKAADGEIDETGGATKVYCLIGDENRPDSEEPENIDQVHFISKPAEEEPRGLMARLLNQVLDKAALRAGAVLIEYNIETGVVLSVFYGDRGGAGFCFTYDDDSTGASVYGPRGMGAYAPIAAIRKQGYYGVGDTSALPGAAGPLSVAMYDSCDDGAYPAGSTSKNLLFARITIPEEYRGDCFTISILGNSGAALSAATFFPDELCADFEAALYDPFFPGLYREPWPAGEALSIIWILDYVEEDTGNPRRSIGDSYDPAGLITARVDNITAGSGAESFGKHPYCGAGSYGDRFIIRSARHLYNIHYVLHNSMNPVVSGTYTQMADIDLVDPPHSGVSRFSPIPAFSGAYHGNGYAIKNLRVDAGGDAGLFAQITHGGVVDNLMLENPEVRGGGPAGAICGVNAGTVDTAYIKYDGAGGSGSDAGKLIYSPACAGGVAGVNSGTIKNVTFISPLPKIHIDGGVPGGIAGRNTGSVSGALFLALAPKDPSGDIVPIANGVGAGVYNAYYLSGSFIRPGPQDPYFHLLPDDWMEFNRENCAGPGLGFSTWDLHDKLNKSQGFSLPGWAKRPGLKQEAQTDARDATNYKPVYPYPFTAAQSEAIPLDPGWPIAGGRAAAAELEYYEFYGNGGNERIFVPCAEFGRTRLPSRVVTHEGYSIRMALYGSGAPFKLGIGGYSYNIFADKGGAAVSVESPAGLLSAWPFEVLPEETSPAEEHAQWIRLFIPNSVMEEASAGLSVKVTLDDPWEEEGLVMVCSVNPVFAPREYGLIRSPRHIDNIDLAGLGGDYTQQLPVDFALYQKKATLVGGAVLSDGASRLSFADSAVVAGTFSGSYNGGGKEIRNITITGDEGVTGLFAINAGNIGQVVMLRAVVSGYTAGAIAGENAGVIGLCQVGYAEVSGAGAAGGVAGVNSGRIAGSCVQYSTVAGDPGGAAGGIAGNNASAGIVEDVFFLSTAQASAAPVSGGGIAGDNSGTVIRAFYLAPAPGSADGAVTTIYPIVRTGAAAVKNGNDETCFYLAGHRYSLDGGNSWINTRYNYSIDYSVRPSGGGKGLITNFIDREWLNYIYHSDLAGWRQPSKGYPYPIPEGFREPLSWPQADSPSRPDQVDAGDWVQTLPTSNRAGKVRFINGDFEMPLMNPDNASEIYEILRIPQITTAPPSMTGGVLSGGFCTSTNSGTPGAACPPARDGSDAFGMYTYYHAGWVQGWNTRPVSAGDAGNAYANFIEFQRPYSSALAAVYRFGRTRTNYEGGLTGAYVELNAEIPGTLYQVCATEPGSELYYSFYHARRNDGNETGGNQRMDFFLSAMADRNGTWAYADGSGRPGIVRPCITPRGTHLNQPATRNTVVYGHTGTAAAEPVTVSRVDFYDPKMHDGAGGIRNAYLIDLWVGAAAGGITNAPYTSLSGDGYGVTFWYDGPTVPAIGLGTGQIPVGGVRNITDAKSSASAANANQHLLPAYLLASAQNNVIGYWDVRRFNDLTGAGAEYSEWKQYYGLYAIPDGQITTEFAFESASARRKMEGNYLDGIRFQSPGFLSIDKHIRMDGETVGFVKPENRLTVELNVKHWGEIPVNSIVIEDRLSPYDAYITYVDGSAKVTRVDGAAAGAAVSEPNAANNHTLTAAFPPDYILEAGQEIQITFAVDIDKEVKGHIGVSTMLYYFKNQAVVSYYDAGYRAYASAAGAGPNSTGMSQYHDHVKRNASGPGPLQVFIDPIKLSTKIRTAGAPLLDPLIDGPFEVEIKAENTLESSNPITTTGLINVLIPPGFTLTDKGTLPGSTLFINNQDGSTRITIRGVNLDSGHKESAYRYTLTYAGAGYGVAYAMMAAEYRYLYEDASMEQLNVMLRFPRPVVGISIKAAEDGFLYDASAGMVGTALYDILGNDNFTEKYADGNYDVSPEIILLYNGAEAETNAKGNYQINHAFYTAELVRSTNQLRFTPKPGAGGDYEFYYQIRLLASKMGGAPENFVLSSAETKVTVHVE